ncbi:hypothetical protein MSTO_03440 [Mycobacterium stomatepiae]|uniref:Uncharacterized protein n=1 Tax=Mycobacterium stomatepiae TaxID=470076 RepID=A0A7I7Q1P9_9MYCO|nr:hypothetical protein MSTO_03440 [Mycobacterium stomatepiae]
MWRRHDLRRAIQHVHRRRARATASPAASTATATAPAADLVRPRAARLGQHLRAHPIYQHLHRDLSGRRASDCRLAVRMMGG